MVQKENFEKHDARAMSSSVQIRKKPSALADGVVTGNPLLFAYDSMKSQKKQHPNT